MMELPLQAYICAGRWSCANINKPGCNALPKKGSNKVYCDIYERREYKGEQDGKTEEGR